MQIAKKKKINAQSEAKRLNGKDENGLITYVLYKNHSGCICIKERFRVLLKG